MRPQKPRASDVWEASSISEEALTASSGRFSTPYKKVTPLRAVRSGVTVWRPALGGQVAQLIAVLLAKLAEGPIPELTDPLPGDAHHPTNLLQGTGLPVIQTEVQTENLRVARRLP